MDGMIESALSSLDRASGGFLSGLTATKVEYAESEDKTHLIVRVHMPEGADDDARSAPRNLSATVIGQAHLRLATTTSSGPFVSKSTHTVMLPRRVSQEGMEINAKPDGSVHISLPILKDDQGATENTELSHLRREASDDGFLHLPFRGALIPALFAHMADAPRDEDEARLQVPSEQGIDSCREKHRDERLLVNKCICDVTPDPESKAVCYGSLISKSVSMARRMSMDEFATSAKHTAIECASGREDKGTCLEKVARNILESLYRQKDSNSDLTSRIREAIESEDDGPSHFESTSGLEILASMVKAFLGVVLVLAAFGSVILYLYRRDTPRGMAMGSVHRLSSVLAQGSGSPDRNHSSSGAAVRGARGARGNKGASDAVTSSGSKLA